jgi:hypothetical protein
MSTASQPAFPVVAHYANTGYAPRMSKLSPRISDQLRDAVKACGKSAYRISKDTGLSAALLSRFLNGETGLSQASIDMLCAYFGLKLAPRSKADGNAWRVIQRMAD